jgi:hypothetical protein
MVWAPTKANREAIRFWLDCLQIVTVVAGVVAVGGTFYSNSMAEQARLNEQAQRDTEQLAAIKRELERPYQEKKLALYLDAARVLAHLAASPNVEKESTEARFWELYWGELAFVESRTIDEAKDGPPSVEKLMVQFCKQYFKERCDKSESQAAAIKMATQASKEVRDLWEKIGQSTNSEGGVDVRLSRDSQVKPE